MTQNTKIILLVGDGMADHPLPELKNKTPLEVARIPNMNWLAKNGSTGWVKTVPANMQPGSDVANLSLLGYDPSKVYTGRGPFEALSQGVHLLDDEWALRLNFVTIKDGLMKDFSAGHISTAEAHQLIKTINEKLGDKHQRFIGGVSYRNLFITRQNMARIIATPPHDISGQKIKNYLPKGSGNETLKKLFHDSEEILKNHPVNLKRIAEGRLPATHIWLWGQGKKPRIPSFYEKYKLRGSVITAVDLLKGIAIAIGLDPINVPGATGYYDTNYTGKAEYALKSLVTKDFVFVHVEAPDEAGHNGELDEKIKAIENFDKFIVGPILGELRKKYTSFKITVLPDHPTPVKIRTHVNEPVPFAIYRPNIKPDAVKKYNEKSVRKSKVHLEGYRLLDYIIDL
jgi:2,3-bisphosphoglycerate-independent phosphoglycerate mutase